MPCSSRIVPLLFSFLTATAALATPMETASPFQGDVHWIDQIPGYDDGGHAPAFNSPPALAVPGINSSGSAAGPDKPAINVPNLIMPTSDSAVVAIQIEGQEQLRSNGTTYRPLRSCAGALTDLSHRPGERLVVTSSSCLPQGMKPASVRVWHLRSTLGLGRALVTTEILAFGESIRRNDPSLALAFISVTGAEGLPSVALRPTAWTDQIWQGPLATAFYPEAGASVPSVQVAIGVSAYPILVDRNLQPCAEHGNCEISFLACRRQPAPIPGEAGAVLRPLSESKFQLLANGRQPRIASNGVGTYDPTPRAFGAGGTMTCAVPITRALLSALSTVGVVGEADVDERQPDLQLDRQSPAPSAAAAKKPTISGLTKVAKSFLKGFARRYVWKVIITEAFIEAATVGFIASPEGRDYYAAFGYRRVRRVFADLVDCVEDHPIKFASVCF